MRPSVRRTVREASHGLYFFTSPLISFPVKNNCKNTIVIQSLFPLYVWCRVAAAEYSWPPPEMIAHGRRRRWPPAAALSPELATRGRAVARAGHSWPPPLTCGRRRQWSWALVAAVVARAGNLWPPPSRSWVTRVLLIQTKSKRRMHYCIIVWRIGRITREYHQLKVWNVNFACPDDLISLSSSNWWKMVGGGTMMREIVWPCSRRPRLPATTSAASDQLRRQRRPRVIATTAGDNVGREWSAPATTTAASDQLRRWRRPSDQPPRRRHHTYGGTTRVLGW
jgi:hypothetical protein